MSEEKPTFKVTDRRLFNPDGSPREDIEREEEPPTPAPAAPGATEASAATEQHDDSADIVDAAYVPRDEASAAAAAQPAPERFSTEAAQAAEADDPQEFLMVVEFVASFAADALGMVEHPGAGRGEVNLPLAKQCIDMLGTLRKKTRGNLSAEEEHVFDLILSQLRMQYVQMSNAPRGPQAPRGFTGGDITGGR